jgi:hypothetical protein
MRKVTTLATKKSSRDARRLMRYLKVKASGNSREAIAAIAAEEGISLRTVKESYAEFEQYEQTNSEGQMSLAIRHLVIALVPQAAESIGGLLNATTITSVKNHKTGMMENVLVEDKTTRLEAGRLVKDLVIGMQPKTPMVAIQNNQTNQVATMSATESNEERLARLRKKAQEHTLRPPEVAAVPSYIDAGGDAEDDEDDGDEEEDGE